MLSMLIESAYLKLGGFINVVPGPLTLPQFYPFAPNKMAGTMVNLEDVGRFHMAWKEVQNQGSIYLKDLQKQIPNYKYADRTTAQKTDEQVCERVEGHLNRGKDSLFSLNQLLFELQLDKAEKGFASLVQSLHDDLESLVSDIQSRSSTFKPVQGSILLQVVKHDRELLNQANGVASAAEDVFAVLVKQLKGKRSEAKLFAQATKDLEKLRFLLWDTVVVFQERDKLCNFEPVTFEQTFNRLRRKIREKL